MMNYSVKDYLVSGPFVDFYTFTVDSGIKPNVDNETERIVSRWTDILATGRFGSYKVSYSKVDHDYKGGIGPRYKWNYSCRIAGAWFKVQCGPCDFGRNKIRDFKFIVNPSKCTNSQLYLLGVLFRHIANYGNHSSWIENINDTRLDVTADVYGCYMEDLWVKCPRKRNSVYFFNNDPKASPSTLIGSKPWELILYDKYYQEHEADPDVHENNTGHVRAEVRLYYDVAASFRKSNDPDFTHGFDVYSSAVSLDELSFALGSDYAAKRFLKRIKKYTFHAAYYELTPSVREVLDSVLGKYRLNLFDEKKLFSPESMRKLKRPINIINGVSRYRPSEVQLPKFSLSSSGETISQSTLATGIRRYSAYERYKANLS